MEALSDKVSNSTMDLELETRSDTCLVGLDEAGVGPGFGSLWAAAVHIRRRMDGLKDSKSLSAKKRSDLRRLIFEHAWVGLGEVTTGEIDTLGMSECRKLVFERALQNFEETHDRLPTKIIVDGTMFRAWKSIPFELHIKGDTKFSEISAAGIVAKTSRDSQIEVWCQKDPELIRKYDILSNKGYFTPKHILGIREYGMGDLHRKTFVCKQI